MLLALFARRDAAALAAAVVVFVDAAADEDDRLLIEALCKRRLRSDLRCRCVRAGAAGGGAHGACSPAPGSRELVAASIRVLDGGCVGRREQRCCCIPWPVCPPSPPLAATGTSSRCLWCTRSHGPQSGVRPSDAGPLLLSGLFPPPPRSADIGIRAGIGGTHVRLQGRISISPLRHCHFSPPCPYRRTQLHCTLSPSARVTDTPITSHNWPSHKHTESFINMQFNTVSHERTGVFTAQNLLADRPIHSSRWHCENVVRRCTNRHELGDVTSMLCGESTFSCLVGRRAELPTEPRPRLLPQRRPRPVASPHRRYHPTNSAVSGDARKLDNLDLTYPPNDARSKLRRMFCAEPGDKTRTNAGYSIADGLSGAYRVLLCSWFLCESGLVVALFRGSGTELGNTVVRVTGVACGQERVKNLCVNMADGIL